MVPSLKEEEEEEEDEEEEAILIEFNCHSTRLQSDYIRYRSFKRTPQRINFLFIYFFPARVCVISISYFIQLPRRKKQNDYVSTLRAIDRFFFDY